MRPPCTLVLLLCAVLGAAGARAEPRGDALGPAPRDASGRFENLAGPVERAGPSVTFPFFLRRLFGGLRTRPNAPEIVANDGA